MVKHKNFTSMDIQSLHKKGQACKQHSTKGNVFIFADFVCVNVQVSIWFENQLRLLLLLLLQTICRGWCMININIYSLPL